MDECRKGDPHLKPCGRPPEPNASWCLCGCDGADESWCYQNLINALEDKVASLRAELEELHSLYLVALAEKEK